MSTAVIIITRNEGLEVKRTVDSFLDSDASDYEIFVIDDGSEDSSCEFLRNADYSSLNYFRNAESIGISRSRNLGAELAGNFEILLFSDAHVRVPHHWQESLECCLTRDGDGRALVGPVLSDLQRTDKIIGAGMTISDYGILPSFLERGVSRVSSVPLLGGGFIYTTASLHRELGGFNESMKGLGVEDVEYCLRAYCIGAKLLVANEVVVAHLFREVPPYRANFVDTLCNSLVLAYEIFPEKEFSETLRYVLDSSNGFLAILLFLDRIKSRPVTRLESFVESMQDYFAAFPIGNPNGSLVAHALYGEEFFAYTKYLNQKIDTLPGDGILKISSGRIVEISPTPNAEL